MNNDDMLNEKINTMMETIENLTKMWQSEQKIKADLNKKINKMYDQIQELEDTIDDHERRLGEVEGDLSNLDN